MGEHATADSFDTRLPGVFDNCSNAQIGGLGEETARFFLEDELGASIVSLGDAGMPRTGHQQDLDITAVIDGVFIAFEVKTRYFARRAGRLTREGDLLRPRLGRTTSGVRQGSQPYMTERISSIVDTDDADYAGVEVQVIVVDFRLMMLQFFTVDDQGRLLSRVGPPIDCRGAAQSGFEEIIGHRGHL